MALKLSSGTAAKFGLVSLLFLAPFALAKDIPVKLTGAREVPAVSSAAAGTGTVSIGEDKSVKGSVTTTGVEGTAAHIHLGATGKNGPPIIALVKSGDNHWSVPANSQLTDEQYKSFKNGELYVNVHSAAHPGGEIRAQLQP